VADRICDELEKRLIGVQVKRLEDRKKIVEENLRQVLLEVCLQNKIDLLEKAEKNAKKGEPFVLLFVGINGTGKTTTIAKVAQFFETKAFQLCLLASDTYRAGSIEQLEEHAKRLGLRLIKHKYGADPAAVAYDAISHAKAHGVKCCFN
jgi:fused signal recognition particle receptor